LRLRPSLLLAAAALFIVAIPAQAGLTEGPRLAAIYDTILQARFDTAEAQLHAACPPAPAEACQALGVVALWWRIQLDPDSHALDGAFSSRAEAAIAAARAWTVREPRRGEAWFYLAGSYAPLVQWRVLRGQRLAAAREGNKIREALEQALTLDPSLKDAYFGIGLYHYYADVAPAGAKFLRWLLLLPGGDRVKGLQEMLRARDGGELLTGEADYQMHFLYLWYEQQPAQARALLERLDAKYPANPIFLERLATIDDEYFHDDVASELHWRALAERASRGAVSAPDLALARARLGLARALDRLDETDRAIEPLDAIVASGATAPYGIRAAAELQLGILEDRLGERDRAVAAYRAALAAAPADDPADIRKEADERIDRAPNATRAIAYRHSLEGWRALSRGDTVHALALLDAAHAALPGDGVVRYRWSRALDAAGRHDEARQALEAIASAPNAAPAFVRASAYVDLARSIERTDRARAIALYRAALAVVGGDRRSHDDATRALKRLASSTRS
jgi:tetratricopeptide (TPR) repeat protein